MTPHSTDAAPKEDALFAAALKLPEDERSAFLDRACKGNDALRARVQVLLSAHDEPNSLLDTEAVTPDTERSASSPIEAIGQVIGRYKLLEKLGEGGFGSVWAAEQREPVKRRVALKVIKLGMDTKQVVARFEAERQALALMDHPNIAKVLDAGTTETGRPFFVMELVKGIPITRYCLQEKLGTEERLDLFIKVCHAIQHAHQKGIIHRDIKPNNILVTLHDGVPVPKVIDFGIAKATQQELTELTIYTQHHQFIGTPAYMSPEQAEMSGLDIDTRSDIYSLGVLLYELLTGSTPFDSKELMQSGMDEMRKIIREREPVKPSTRLSQTLSSSPVPSATPAPSASLPSDLDWIVMKCLEKDRSRRYDTANGLAADLQRHLTNEPIVARPPSITYKLQKAWRRNRIMFSAAALVIIALTGGLALATLGMLSARRAERNEAQLRVTADHKAEEARLNAEEAETARRLTNENLYLSLVGQAYREVGANRPSDALQFLDQCPAEWPRGWEWHYVRNRCFSAPLPQWQIPGFSQSSTFNETGMSVITLGPHGRDLAVVTPNGLQLWMITPDAQLQPHSTRGPSELSGTEAKGNVFSQDGTQLAVVLKNDAVTLWDVASNKVIWSLPPQPEMITGIAFHPTQPRIATLSDDLAIRVWSTQSSQPSLIQTIEKAGTYEVTYSPDGRWLAVGAWSYVNVFDAETGEERCRLGRLAVPVGPIAFSPDSTALVATENTKIKRWSIPSGESLGDLDRHKAWLLSVAFSHDGKRLVSSGLDHQVKIWDWDTGRETLTLTEHRNAVGFVAFTTDGRVLSADFDGVVSLWDGAVRNETGRDEIGTLKRHTNRIWSLAFTPDGRLLSSGEDDRGCIWDLDRHEPAHLFDGLFDVSASKDGRYLITAHGWGHDEPAKTWEETIEGDFSHVVRVIDSLTLKEHFRVSDASAFLCAEMSPDGKLIAAGGYVGQEATKNHLQMWEWREGGEPHILETRNSGFVDVAFSTDGRYLATASEDGVVKRWDATRWQEPQEGKVLWPRSPVREFAKIAISPDSQRLATGNGGNEVMVIDLETGDPVLPPLEGHGDTVLCVAYSPNGRWLASAGADHTVCLWNAGTGALLHRYVGHSSVINAVAFSPDSRILASGGSKGVIKLWRVDAALP